MSLPIILVLNGPNLNMLGLREPEIYGHAKLSDIEFMCREVGETLGLDIDFKQTNHEGIMVDWIQEARGRVAGVVINAAAYTHTSVAIHDALKLLENTPIAEVHISNPKERESFRHVSYIEPLAFAHFVGHGAQGYVMAVEAVAERFGKVNGDR
ncbi:MAG: 3-dehydroquinate dehydratase [Alphaproteobacteria bacterium]|jgi:3-dehydroquinate dehydratase-2|nr:3-dehydroquinate dehydratase [Alphaproteobacteria bacterium]MCB1550465.1 3-dehydroquinate dehydratase [Alphaproteobacteria bacterium]MCB9985960.1 3-dehydroquinate dehydratase [Micavibrio sp.]HRK96885.1 type II 3-dehydroquinate dehydratase [Alphaproteobacteria bacterium]